MANDAEIDAMTVVANALDNLDSDARTRVLRWAVSRFGQVQTRTAVAGYAPNELDASSQLSDGCETFAELFAAANPTTEREKALVAGYWTQVCEGQPMFVSQALNDALKNLGHGVGNITDALTQLRNDRPALVLQLKKSGTSKQSRKTYKLTIEGIKRVESMTRNVEKRSDDS